MAWVGLARRAAVVVAPSERFSRLAHWPGGMLALRGACIAAGHIWQPRARPPEGWGLSGSGPRARA